MPNLVNFLVPTQSGLPPHEHSFCHHLICDPALDGTEAYLKVSPNVARKTANGMATKYLKKPKIREYIGELLKKRQKRMEMDEDWVMHGLRDIYDRCMEAEPVYGKNAQPDELGVMPEPIYFKFDANGATKALELIGKHMRMFSDKVDVANMTVQVALSLGENKEPIEGEYKRVS